MTNTQLLLKRLETKNLHITEVTLQENLTLYDMVELELCFYEPYTRTFSLKKIEKPLDIPF